MNNITNTLRKGIIPNEQTKILSIFRSITSDLKDFLENYKILEYHFRRAHMPKKA